MSQAQAERKTAQAAVQKAMCKKHDKKEFVGYCNTCEELTCTKCLQSDHSNHDCDTFKAGANKKRNELPEILHSIRSRDIPKMRQHIENIKTTISKNKDTFEREAINTAKARDNLIQMVTRVFSEKIASRKSEFEKCQKELEERQGVLTKAVDDIEKGCRRLEENSKQPLSDYDFLASMSEIREKAGTYGTAETPLRSFETQRVNIMYDESIIRDIVGNLAVSRSVDIPTVPRVSFSTQEGLLLYVYTGNLMELSVDCIVNSANAGLLHDGGLSKVLSENAGADFQRESLEYLEKNGPLNVGNSCSTTAGTLPYSCVIHTVGPQWSASRSQDCFSELEIAIAGALCCANEKGMESVAIPAISAGSHGMPRELCAKHYAEGVRKYSLAYLGSSGWGRHAQTLKEVHFVDIDDELIHMIEEAFRKVFNETSVNVAP